ncbi:hypothetical protein AAF712_012539 [Marasmius tenuissimus]|uniref:Uncharacterized protein n=1 Tax=Marasmius tenuissimus TaxID=585030 RepID=A0ABR2ZG65_9AGAR
MDENYEDDNVPLSSGKRDTGANAAPIGGTKRWGGRHHNWTDSSPNKNDSGSVQAFSGSNTSQSKAIGDWGFLLDQNQNTTVEQGGQTDVQESSAWGSGLTWDSTEWDVSDKEEPGKATLIDFVENQSKTTDSKPNDPWSGTGEGKWEFNAMKDEGTLEWGPLEPKPPVPNYPEAKSPSSQEGEPIPDRQRPCSPSEFITIQEVNKDAEKASWERGLGLIGRPLSRGIYESTIRHTTTFISSQVDRTNVGKDIVRWRSIFVKLYYDAGYRPAIVSRAVSEALRLEIKRRIAEAEYKHSQKGLERRSSECTGLVQMDVAEDLTERTKGYIKEIEEDEQNLTATAMQATDSFLSAQSSNEVQNKWKGVQGTLARLDTTVIGMKEIADRRAIAKRIQESRMQRERALREVKARMIQKQEIVERLTDQITRVRDVTREAEVLEAQESDRAQQIAKLQAMEKVLVTDANDTRCRNKAVDLIIERAMEEEICPALKELGSQWNIARDAVCTRVVAGLERYLGSQTAEVS